MSLHFDDDDDKEEGRRAEGERKGEKKRGKGRHAREVRIGVLLLALLPIDSELQKSLDVSGPSFLFNKMNRCEASGEHEGSPPFLEAQIPNWSQPTLPISVIT